MVDFAHSKFFMLEVTLKLQFILTLMKYSSNVIGYKDFFSADSIISRDTSLLSEVPDSSQQE